MITSYKNNFALFLAFATTMCISFISEGAKPNFVFILVDDMGWNGMSVLSDNRNPQSKSDFYSTPSLERLAGDGIVFSRAYAPSPMCTPSRASFLTGKSPAQLHMTTPGPVQRAKPSQKIVPPRHRNQLPSSEVTIAELLRKYGYVTAHLGKWHLGAGGPGMHGFDRHDGETGNSGPGVYTDPNPKDIFGITERAQEFISEQVRQKRPFYVQLSHYAVHTPVLARKKTVSMFENKKRGRVHSDANAAAMTYDFDQSVGMVLDTLKKLKIEKNTYVIFMSDNGGGSKPNRSENYPLAGGKASLWEGGIRVPLIIAGPGIAEGVYNHTNCIGYDLFPTISELAGVKSSELSRDIEGVSLVSLLRGYKKKIIRNNEEFVFHFPHYGKGPNQKPQSAVIIGDYKLIKFYESDSFAVYDLGKDIQESKPLKDKALESTLYKTMMANLKRIDAQMPTMNTTYDKSAKSSTRKRNRFIDRMDKNGDGKVSRNEFMGASRRFNHIDANGDGYIDASEAPRGPSKKR